jgi:hypothetical protein
MKETLDAFAFWLRSTQISHAVRLEPWLWPTCEILHFTGLSLLVGAAGFFDLRLLGFFPRIPISAAWSMIPWAKVGFAMAMITGATFFIGAPDQYVNNVAFYGKVLFLILANANAIYFEMAYRKQVERKELDARPPNAFKVIAGVSIVSWFFVIYWGRMLPFVGNAF